MRAERLAVAELDDVAARILDRAEIAGRRGIIAGLPVQNAVFAPALGDPVDILARRNAEAVMRHVVLVLRMGRSAAKQDEHEILLLPRTRQPNHAPFAHAVLLDGLKPAIGAIEGDR